MNSSRILAALNLGEPKEHTRLAAMVDAITGELVRQGVAPGSDIDILALAKVAVAVRETTSQE